MGQVVQLTDENFGTEVLKSDVPVLVDFWAPWCGPCRMVGPIVEELAGQYAGRIKVGKLNVDDNQITATNYKVRGIPTLLLFKNGEVADQMVGAAPKPKLEEFVQGQL
ncbi:MAG: thioredoxin [Deltaproteobacteria bacterium]|nr:thioredoxin [bacterium]MCB9477695.1 thioredoxin [Deltaproteobacteria bacterium]MCB9478538.1 thioredoxin [Deltaproteobacteria bacterium]MCB9488381.1 thioredoxin [Deltaproteobacteria bacterium]